MGVSTDTAPRPADLRTRDRVARTLLESGQTTVAVLAERLGLTPAAVRRHLDALVAEGLVATAEDPPGRPRGRGRPARRFALTASGHGAFPQAYDDLAASALRFLAEQAGEEAVAAFARARVAELESRYAARLAAPSGRPLGRAEQVSALAEALSGDGYAASTREASATGRPPGGSPGLQLCQHHCPVASVAAKFPQLCEAEAEIFARLLGTHVTRLSTIATGSSVCTTHVPVALPTAPTATTGTTSGTTTTKRSSA